MSAFARAPFIVVWETTRACALACVHCRAEAIPHRNPGELTTGEGKRLIDRVAAFGDPPPILVLTGGDPLRRPDIPDLVAHGARHGVAVSLTPSGTAAVSRRRLRELQEAGLARLAVSLDGASPETHDAFRGVRGSHRHTMVIIEEVRALGLPLQVNTTVSRQTVAELPLLARQIEALGVVLWALFFLVPVGRALTEDTLGASEIEGVLDWAADLAGRSAFGVKTTEAPHYHRVLAQRGRDIPGATPRAAAAPIPGLLGAGPAARGSGRAPRAVTDGNGFAFVDHLGNICPSGFLPLPVGNVRGDDLVAVYREDPLFVALRDPSRLGGRCGRCEYREPCGGSRARAYAATGDPLGEDPGCVYAPGEAGAAPAFHRAISGGSGSPPPVTREAVMGALRGVLDPELGMSVVTLGLIYAIEIQGGRVSITMTLTAQGCPIHDVIGDWVREAVMGLPGVEQVEVTITFEPPWTPDRISLEPHQRG